MLYVHNEKELKNGFEKIKEEIGGLDIVIANAGIVPNWRSIDSIDDEEWENVLPDVTLV